ncbi:HNH endonuclease [Klebsiella quasipneumoniae]|uniref:HNH endonuclease n=1 Tax=Klebsiella quasipneumoniae TaxID=1463165 RepID=UPI00336A524E
MKSYQLEGVVFSDASLSYISNYDGVSYKIWNNQSDKSILKIRKEIREQCIPQQKYWCAYCRQLFLTTDGYVWTVEHILSKSKHPKFLFEPLNLALVCRDCNRKKSAKEDLIDGGLDSCEEYPKNSKDFNIIHPHFDKYSMYIELIVQGGRYIYNPLHSKGKKTIEICDLTRYALFEVTENIHDDCYDYYKNIVLESDDDDDDDDDDGKSEEEKKARKAKLVRKMELGRKRGVVIYRDFRP